MNLLNGGSGGYEANKKLHCSLSQFETWQLV